MCLQAKSNGLHNRGFIAFQQAEIARHARPQCAAHHAAVRLTLDHHANMPGLANQQTARHIK